MNEISLPASLLADVRNKLTPIKNLIAMLENGLVQGTIEVHPLIIAEIEECKKSVSYLSRETEKVSEETHYKEASVLKKEYDDRIHLLRKKFINDNAEFKVGDFIFNITGIIKIEKILYQVSPTGLETIYSGYRYKKIKNVLSRTKDRALSRLKYDVRLVNV